MNETDLNVYSIKASSSTFLVICKVDSRITQVTRASATHDFFFKNGYQGFTHMDTVRLAMHLCYFYQLA
jgi:hypothetical protein